MTNRLAHAYIEGGRQLVLCIACLLRSCSQLIAWRDLSRCAVCSAVFCCIALHPAGCACSPSSSHA